MATERPRVRPQRLALLVVLVVLLALLLEMNRWLPGGWPGGGGRSGFRTLDVAPGADPARLGAPPEPSPDWRPEKGVVVEVRSPDGTTQADWRVGVGGRSALEGPGLGVAELPVRDGAVFTEGIRVRWPAGEVRHVPPARVPPSPRWRVQVPAAAPPAPLQPRPLAVEVTDALSGAPVAGARVFGPAGLDGVVTDAQGRATLAGVEDRALVRVTATGYLETVGHGHARTAEPLRVRLSPRLALRLAFSDPATGAEAPVTAARLLDAEGRTLWEAPDGAPRTVRVEAELPAERLGGARLEVDAPGRPRTLAALPERGGRVALAPAGRAIEVVLRDTSGRDVPALAATVRRGPPAGGAVPGSESAGVEERVRADAGRLTVHVPEGEEAVVVVESEGHAPVALRVAAGDTAGPRDVVPAAGLRVPVRVLDARGRPVRDARVLARCVLDGVRVTVEARTDEEGAARVGPVPPGPVELFTHAPGRAWGGKTETAAPAMGSVELRLRPGAPLHLVVETPLGAPLPGVHVTAVPLEDLPGVVEPPDAVPWRTGADGALLVEDLPVRPYRLRLALPGHADETLHDVRPGAVTYFATLSRAESGSPPR